MASQHGRAYFQLTAKQTTNLASTNSSTLRSFPIFLPPLPEQQAILDSAEQATGAIGRAVERAKSEIALLRDYRTRLIADVVTGKLDVRKAAARLPAEPDVSEDIDEPEAPLADDENLPAADPDDLPEEAAE